MGEKIDGGRLPYPERLRNKREFWEKVLHAKRSELNLLEKHTPKFKDDIPPVRYHSVPRSGREGGMIKEKNIKSHKAAEDLEKEGIVKKVSEEEVVVGAPHYIKEENGGKESWIWVGDHTNERIEGEPYKVETAEYVREWIREGYWGYHLDIKKAFFHGKIDPEFRKYFGFITRDEQDRIHYWVFESLPMGYRLSPVLFYRLMTPIMRYLRRRAISMTLFVDDAMGQAETEGQARKEGEVVRETLVQAGFTLSEKCDWEPKQEIEHIGYIWDLKRGKIRLTERRLKKTREGLAAVAGKAGTWVTHRKIAKSAGRALSTRLVKGNIVRILTRAMFAVATPPSEREWDRNTRINVRMEKEVKLLQEVMEEETEISFVQEIERIETDARSDASDTGTGGYLRKVDGREIGRKTAAPLPEGITGEDSSCLREMEGGLAVVKENRDMLNEKRFSLGLDNKGAVQVFKIGSSIEELQDRAIEMYQFCRKELGGAVVIPYWLPRKDNKEADELSKDVDYNDYQMSRGGLEWVMEELGIKAGELIDAFGNPWDELRAKGVKYWSRYYYRGSAGVDAMMQRWGGRQEQLWWFPPIPMLVAVLNKIVREEARGILIFPIWPNRPYMPLLFDEIGHARGIIKEWRILLKGSLQLGRQGRPWFLTHPIEGERTQFVVVRIEASRKGGREQRGPTLCLQRYFTGRCEG